MNQYVLSESNISNSRGFVHGVDFVAGNREISAVFERGRRKLIYKARLNWSVRIFRTTKDGFINADRFIIK